MPADRARLREQLAPFDTVLVVGAPVFRQSAYAPGRFTEPGTRVALVADDPEEVHRSPVELAVLAPPAAVCRELVRRLPAREAPLPSRSGPRHRPRHRGRASRCWPPTCWRRWPSGCPVMRSSWKRRPSTGRSCTSGLRAREPLGYLSAAMGGLGFALPGATGLRMALPRRPIVAVVGDGSAIYQIHAVWSATHYRVGVLFVILSNAGYVVMDRLAERQGAAGPWPSFGEVELAAVANGFGCPARRIDDARRAAGDAGRRDPDAREPQRAAAARRRDRAHAGLRPLTPGLSPPRSQAMGGEHPKPRTLRRCFQ